MALRRDGNPEPGRNGRNTLHVDHPSTSLRTSLGSTSVVLNEQLQKVDEIRYYPFGEAYAGDPGTATTDYAFTGQRWSGYVGLYYYGARWYDAQVGRFVQADSIVPDSGNPQTLNRYAYVANNPLRYIDPSGHRLICGAAGGDCGSGGGGGGGGGGGNGSGGGHGGGYGGGGGSGNGAGVGHGGSGGNNSEAGTYQPLLNQFQLSLVRYYAAQYQLPWQVVAGLLEAEIRLDTEPKDLFEDLVIGLLPFLTYIKGNGAGPGIGNVHVVTAKRVSQYFAREYPDRPEMQLWWHAHADWQVAWLLVRNDYNIMTVAAYVRQLADYRFGSNGQPLKADHSDLDTWTITDALAIWHGYRYGVAGVSAGGEGFGSVTDFQARQYGYTALLDRGLMTGIGGRGSVLGAVPVFRYYFGQ